MKDLTGQRFGNLVVIRPNGKRFNKKAWLCQCDCGNFYTGMTVQLTSGKAKSCGCSHYGCKDRNHYDLSNEFGIGFLKDGIYFLFDKEDYDKIKETKWYYDKNGYVCSCNEWLHRVITDCPKGMEVDHINHNTLDNRKSNLRICTHQENLMNQNLNKNNKSGNKGVCYSKSINKYVATIGFKGKTINLGSYSTIDEAISVRKEAELKYFKQYSNKNLIER